MQSGAPTFGTPEPALVLYVMAALARRLGVPFRSGGSLCASKVADAQAAYESAATLQPTVLGGVNFVLHAAGWLEGGLAVGYEKFILDADQCGMMAVFVKGVDLSENGQALDTIRSNGPASTSWAPPTPWPTSRTRSIAARSRTTTASSSGSEDGGLDAPSAPTRSGSGCCAEYEAPPIDPAIDEALLEFIDPAQGVDAGLGGLRPCCSDAARADPAQSARPARGAARARRSSSCRSRTRWTRPRTCRPVRPCR